jgi:hypothetical protein
MLLTAFATPDQHVAADKLGVSGQFTKASFSVRDLRQRVAECLTHGTGARAPLAAAGASNN